MNGSTVALTPREVEVLEALMTGATAIQVAEGLGITFHTARAHIKHLYLKAGVGNRVELVRWWFDVAR